MNKLYAFKNVICTFLFASSVTLGAMNHSGVPSLKNLCAHATIKAIANNTISPTALKEIPEDLCDTLKDAVCTLYGDQLWKLLWEQEAYTIATITGHSHEIDALYVNNNTCITSSLDGTVRIWQRTLAQNTNREQKNDITITSGEPLAKKHKTDPQKTISAYQWPLLHSFKKNSTEATNQLVLNPDQTCSISFVQTDNRRIETYDIITGHLLSEAPLDVHNANCLIPHATKNMSVQNQPQNQPRQNTSTHDNNVALEAISRNNTFKITHNNENIVDVSLNVPDEHQDCFAENGLCPLGTAHFSHNNTFFALYGGKEDIDLNALELYSLPNRNLILYYDKKSKKQPYSTHHALSISPHDLHIALSVENNVYIISIEEAIQKMTLSDLIELVRPRQ